MTLDRWDDTAQITYDRNVWNELCSLRFVESGHNAVIMGPVGVGKTFLATALGHAAVRRRISVHFERCDRLLKRLRASRLDNSHDLEMRKLLRVDLFIIDDFALQALDPLDTADPAGDERTGCDHREVPFSGVGEGSTGQGPPTPLPSNAGSTSVCGYTTRSAVRMYLQNPANSPPTRASKRLRSAASVTVTEALMGESLTVHGARHLVACAPVVAWSVVSSTSVRPTWRRVASYSPAGRIDQWPAPSSSSRANVDGLSKRGSTASPPSRGG
jgi:hypothetical protein